MAILKFFRKFKNLGIQGSFARWYDKNTRENRLAEMREYAEMIRAHISEGSHVLEVAPGPGYVSIELAKMGNYHITGMDISEDFIKICKTNAQNENVNISFLTGNVSQMHFDDNSFDFIFCSAAFKNFKEPVKALKEMHRVLKEGGVALITDMRRDSTKEGLKAEAARISKSGFERMFMVSTFKMLCKSAYTVTEMESMLAETAFAGHEVKLGNISFFLYMHK